MPPTDGAMAEFIVVRSDQCHLLPAGMDDGIGAMIEPTAVALHAINQSGTVSGKRILVTGGGTIGLLTALIAKAFGAVAVVVSEIIEERRRSALSCGVDFVMDPSNLQKHSRDIAANGFDIVFEASGAASALRQSFDLVRPGGTIVQIGTTGMQDIPLPVNQLMVKEIRIVGSFRYTNVFDEAIRLVDAGKINLKPLITDVLSFQQITRAMNLAADKVNALKVQLQF